MRMFLALILVASSCFGQDESADPAKAFEAISSGLKKEMNDFMTLYRSTPSEERQAVLKKRPKVVPYLEKAWNLASENPEHAIAPKALVWILTADREMNPIGDKAIDALLKDHLDSPEMENLPSYLGYRRNEKAAAALQTLAESSPQPDVKAKSMFVMVSNDSRSLKRMAPGPEKEALEAKTIATLETLSADYSEVKTARGKSIGELADAQLFSLTALAIGKEAPEITGENGAGVAIKLSDYRGKVVLIDFWGDW
mgnify:FL=1